MHAAERFGRGLTIEDAAAHLSSRILWQGLSSSWAIVHVAAVVIAILLIWKLNQYERHLLTVRTGRLLLCLRMTALAVVLLALFQPSWGWIIERERVGRVVVALDISESMQSSDPQATTAERLRWATAVGWLNPHPDRLLATFEPSGSPSGRIQTPEGLDEDTWREISSRLAHLPRMELARQALIHGQKSVWDQLKDVGRCQLQWFGGSAIEATIDDLKEPLVAIPPLINPGTTRIGSVLKSLETGNTESPILGVVILTDGRDAESAAAVELAQSLGRNNVPVYPILVGSLQRPKDLAIASIDLPPSVYRGDRPKIKVLVTSAGFDQQPLTVKLSRVDAKPDEPPQTKTITTANGPQLVEFDVQAESLGEFPYQISLPTWEGETRGDNNERQFRLRVVDDRAHVLLVDREPRWEFRYLEIALSRDPRVEVLSILFDQPYVGAMPAPYFSRSWPEPVADGVTPGLTDRDVIIVGDVSSADMPETRWKTIEEFVSEQGGTLVMIAGRQGLPLGQTSQTLQTLLPITDPQLKTAAISMEAGPPIRGWSWSLTPDGLQQAFLQLSSDEAMNDVIWGLLPGASWGIDGRLKPGATVWAYGRDERLDSAIPLIVHQYVGLGQVIWLATDSTWRWRFRSADEFHHRFWGQVIRYGAQSKLSTGNEFVQFGTTLPHYQSNQPVEIQARWSSRLLDQPEDRRQATVEISQANQLIQKVAMDLDPRRPTISLAQVSDLAPGTYRARLQTPNLAMTQPLEAEFTIIAPLTAEMEELSSNPVFLQEIAAASGGQLLHLDEMAELPRLLKPFSGITLVPQEHSLWDRWPTLLLLTAIITAEWIIRRRHGLP